MQLGKVMKNIHRAISQQADCKIDRSKTIDQQVLIFHDRLITIIRPRDQSDRTSFRRISNWLRRKIDDGTYTSEIFEIVLRYATEAAGPDSRNPAAVFMSIIKRELGYGKN